MKAFDSCGWILKDNELVVDIDSIEKSKNRKNHQPIQHQDTNCLDKKGRALLF